MTYVRITDIAATWADYVLPRGLTEHHSGLIIFVAGPTDEGIRTVEVWTSLTDWANRHRAAGPMPEHINSTTRELEAPFAVLGHLRGQIEPEESR